VWRQAGAGQHASPGVVAVPVADQLLNALQKNAVHHRASRQTCFRTADSSQEFREGKAVRRIELSAPCSEFAQVRLAGPF